MSPPKTSEAFSPEAREIEEAFGGEEVSLRLALAEAEMQVSLLKIALSRRERTSTLPPPLSVFPPSIERLGKVYQIPKTRM